MPSTFFLPDGVADENVATDFASHVSDPATALNIPEEVLAAAAFTDSGPVGEEGQNSFAFPSILSEQAQIEAADNFSVEVAGDNTATDKVSGEITFPKFLDWKAPITVWSLSKRKKINRHLVQPLLKPSLKLPIKLKVLQQPT